MSLSEKIQQFSDQIDANPNLGHQEQESDFSEKMTQEVGNALQKLQLQLFRVEQEQQQISDQDWQRWDSFADKLVKIVNKFAHKEDRERLIKAIEEIDARMEKLK